MTISKAEFASIVLDARLCSGPIWNHDVSEVLRAFGAPTADPDDVPEQAYKGVLDALKAACEDRGVALPETLLQALAAWLPLHAGNWSFGPALGPATGYDVPVLGGLLARYAPARGMGVNLILSPPAQKQGSAMVGLQLTWRFGK